MFLVMAFSSAYSIRISPNDMLSRIITHHFCLQMPSSTLLLGFENHAYENKPCDLLILAPCFAFTLTALLRRFGGFAVVMALVGLLLGRQALSTLSHIQVIVGAGVCDVERMCG